MKLCLEAETSNVIFTAMDNLQDRGLWQYCGIRTELKFHEFVAIPDGVALIPTSHDREDDECVDGSAISLATLYVHVFRSYRLVHMEAEYPYRCSLALPSPAFVSLVVILGMKL